MPQIKINTENYPHLEGLMKKNPKEARDIMMVFVGLMEEAVENGWHELPELFSRDLSFSDLIKGILHGSLDLPKLNPDAYDVLKEEVHPLSMLSARKDYLNGGMRIYNWRHHFRIPNNTEINQQTIEEIFRKLLRYYKYVKVDDLAHALVNNQIATFKSMDEVKNLPFYPALRYQQEHFGDLQVGAFQTDNGGFDGGDLPEDYDGVHCPACKGEEPFWELEHALVCPRCNISFKKSE